MSPSAVPLSATAAHGIRAQSRPVINVEKLNKIKHWAAFASHHSQRLMPRRTLRRCVGRQEHERHSVATLLDLALVKHSSFAE